MSRKLSLFSATIAVDLFPAEQAKLHRRRAAQHLERQQFGHARRELHLSLTIEPQNAETHFQLARAYENDPYGCDRRAAKHDRMATKLEPTNAVYWANLARSAVRCNRDELAKRAVRRAVKLAPSNVAVLTIIVEALRELGRLKWAARIVTQARFLSSRDRTISELANHVQFEMARQSQRKQYLQLGQTSPMVLPFMRIVRETGESITIRRDAGSQVVPHIAKYLRRR